MFKELTISASVSTEDRAAIVRDVVDALRPLLEARPKLVDVEVLALQLGLSIATLDRLRRSGKIPSLKLGSRRLYDPEAVLIALQTAFGQAGDDE